MGVSENILYRNYNIFAILTKNKKKYFLYMKKKLYFCSKL